MKRNIITVCACLLAGVLTAVGLCVWTLFRPQPVFAGSVGGFTVVVDAGHGGMDGGVRGKKTGIKESDINLGIALCLRDLLTETGFAVTLTRKTEAGLYDTTAKGFKRRDMQKRKEIIQKVNPAFVVSVHQNFYPSKSTRGAQVFYAKNNAESKRFALALQARLNDLYATQGVKARVATGGEYFMLTCSQSPSVIVECGFLSNAEDERLLSTDGWKRKIADAIVLGLTDCLSA